MTRHEPAKSSANAANAAERVLADTRRNQARASDPKVSAWVSANAGAGKTHVLTLRVLRLLLDGQKPEKILCLTYTKAAAAEMSKRVFAVLAGWVTLADAELATTLADVLGRSATDAEAMLARQLFAIAIETPGGLKVQTIHAFCERLLQRFPLEAGVPPGFSILDDETTATLRRESTDWMLTRATSGSDSALGAALQTAIAYAAEESFDEILAATLGKRDVLEAMVVGDHDAEGDDLDDAGAPTLAALDRALRRTLTIPAGATRESLDRELAGLIDDAGLRRVRDVLDAGTASDRSLAMHAAAALAANAAGPRIEALKALLLTQAGAPRQRLMTKAIAAEHPDVEALLGRAQSACQRLVEQRFALDAIAATLALVRLSDRVMTRYREAKARRAALDFDDLIVATARLLATADQASWVLYKLDGGLDHVLIDESQDTSPLQWDVIRALVAEFFTGEGAREGRRTVFAVGDEKQSIYSFQGAAPEMFAASGEHFAARAAEAGLPFRRLALLLSFRTVAPVLAAVDRVFADAARTPGITSGGAVSHMSWRIGHAGLVEIWPTETYAEPDAVDAWSPLEDQSEASPVVRLAERIATLIRGWIDSGERLASEDRPIVPADILILVGRRRPFADPMIAALKERRIAVAGADRIRITEQIAVEDLIALGDFVLLPDDDLALAVVLKSPILGFTDDDLIRLAAGRRGTLWRSLLEASASEPLYAAAVSELKRWRSRADLAPPFEFFAQLLERDGVRQRLLARLGPDAADPIDEFLSLALTYDDAAAPSLVGFLDWLRQSGREVKRDMEHGRNEVRIMTVHGAKGLEAPIVFLPDTCAAASNRIGAGLLGLDGAGLRPGATAPHLWPIKGSSRLPAVSAGRRRVESLTAEERNRLLYVAMTRARDRLYVAGFEGKKSRGKGCWYDIVCDRLGTEMTTVEVDGRKLLRWEAPQIEEPVAARARAEAESGDVPLPDWALRPAPRERQLSIPMAPSQFVPYETDDDGDPVEAAKETPARTYEAATREPPEPAPKVLAADNRFLRGTLTHALLEHLPAFPQPDWAAVAKAFVARRGRDLSARQRASIVAETLAVLNDPRFAPLFGPDGRAEVPIVTEIANPKRGGPPLVINGQIDRLARVGNDVVIVDYKTNRPPPLALEGVAAAYLFQLAAYRLGVSRIFPGHGVRAAILWTETPRIMEIPALILDQYQSRIWELEALSLDARSATT